MCHKWLDRRHPIPQRTIFTRYYYRTRTGHIGLGEISLQCTLNRIGLGNHQFLPSHRAIDDPDSLFSSSNPALPAATRLPHLNIGHSDWERGAFQCYATPTGENNSMAVDGVSLNQALISIFVHL